MNRRRLYRSADDRIIAGVASGVADYFEVDPSLVRVLWAISIPLTGGFMLLVYIVLAVVLPLGPEDWPAAGPWAPGGPTGYGTYTPPPPGAAGGPAAAPGAPAAAASGASDWTDPGQATQASPEAGAGAEASAPGASDPRPAAPDTAGGQPAGAPPDWSATGTSAWTNAGPGWSGDWRSQRRQERWERRQERRQRRAERWDYRGPGSGALVFGVLLILVGGLLAWHEIDPAFDLNLAWPIAVVALGVILIATSFFGRSSD